MALKINAKNKTAEILLYEDIGEMWGVSAREFSRRVEGLGNGINKFVLRINSNGGSVFDGVTIHNFLKSHKTKLKAGLDVHIDGLAASIASIIAMAADKGGLHMADNAFMMIHDPWSIAIGSSDDMRREADTLDNIRDTLVDTYMKRATGKRDDVSQMMADETWLNAEDALKHGFIDHITDEMAVAASVHKGWFKHPPKQLVKNESTPLPVPNKRVQEMLARTQKSLRKHSAAGV